MSQSSEKCMRMAYMIETQARKNKMAKPDRYISNSKYDRNCQLEPNLSHLESFVSQSGRCCFPLCPSVQNKNFIPLQKVTRWQSPTGIFQIQNMIEITSFSQI